MRKHIQIYLFIFGFFFLQSSFSLTLPHFKTDLFMKTLNGLWKTNSQSNFRFTNNYSMILTKKQEFLTFFKKDVGELEAFFFSDLNQSGRIEQNGLYRGQSGLYRGQSGLYIEMYQQNTTAGNTISLELNLEAYDIRKRKQGDGLTLWRGKDQLTLISLSVNRNVFATFYATLSYEVYVLSHVDDHHQKENQLSFNDSSTISVRIWSDSITFSAQLKHEVVDLYKLFVLGLLLLGLMLLLFIKPKDIMYDISQWLILQTFAFIMVTSILYFKLGLTKADTNYKFLLVIAPIQIILAFFLLRNYEQKMMTFTWKFKLRLFSAFLFIFLYFYLVYEYYLKAYFWIMQVAMLLIFQIVHCFRKTSRGGIQKILFLIIMVSRVPLIIVINSYANFIKLETTPRLAIVFNVNMFFWLVFIFLQYFFGSKFFIIKELIPDYYDYYNVQIQKMDQECSICTQEVGKDPDQPVGEVSNQTVVEQRLTSISRIGIYDVMKTPCGHYFHSKHLKEWMNSKLECPNCRGLLPLSQDQRENIPSCC